MSASTSQPHLAYRIDGYPPSADPARRLYLCRDGCEFLTGPQMQASTIRHEIPDSAALTLHHYQRPGLTGHHTGNAA
jgi:hypothetical protein